MDHKVVSCSSKICDWPLNSSRDRFDLHQEKNVRVTMELEVPKGLYSTLHYPLLWFNKFCSGRDKKVLSLQMSGDHGNEMPFLI